MDPLAHTGQGVNVDIKQKSTINICHPTTTSAMNSCLNNHCIKDSLYILMNGEVMDTFHN